MSKFKTTLALLCLSAAVTAPVLVAASWVSPEPSEESVVVVDNKIDINQADVKTLMTIHNVSKARAQAIVDYREKNGKFKSIYDLEKVKGMNKAFLKKITPAITAN